MYITTITLLVLVSNSLYVSVAAPRRVHPNFVASFDNAIGEKRGLQQKAQSEATSGMISSLFAYFFNPMNKKNINVMNERSLKKRESKVMFECV